MVYPSAAVTRLGQYNNDDYDASTNPYGLDDGGYLVNWVQASQDIGDVAAWMYSLDIAGLLAIETEITTVAGISSAVSTVAANDTDISTVAGISSAVSTVAANDTNISTVAGLDTEIAALGGITADISTVAGDISAVQAAALNTFNLSTDTSPTLAGDLALGGYDITGTGNIDITGNISAYTSGETLIMVDGDAGQYRAFSLATSGNPRWNLVVNNVAEAGGNAGSNLAINAYDDAGSYLLTSIIIERATGIPTFYTDTQWGTFSSSGASNGRYVSIGTGAASMDSSTSTTAIRAHLRYFNPNGEVGNTATTGTGTQFNTSSDENWKVFIGEYDPEKAIAIIKADPVRDFYWDQKRGGEYAVGWGAQTSYGVSQDLASPGGWFKDNQEVPEGTEGAEYHPWSVDQSRRTPYLWAATSWLIDVANDHEKRIAELETELALLKAA